MYLVRKRRKKIEKCFLKIQLIFVVCKKINFNIKINNNNN